MVKSNWRLVWVLVAVSIASNLVLGILHPLQTFWDEQFYNYAATLILRGQACPTISLTVGSSTVPIATSCNYEHPPLVKLMVALTLYVFTPLNDASASGSIPYLVTSFLSYRLVQLVMGALCLPLMYLIGKAVSGDRKLALLASLLLFLDPLFAFFSRLDYLDIPMIFFALCAYAVYFTGTQPASARRLMLTGLMLGLSLLSKETGIVFVIALVAYHLLLYQAGWRRKLGGLLEFLGAAALAGAVGLQLYDTLAATPFPTFIDQIEYISRYSAFLAAPRVCYTFGPVPWYYSLTPSYWMVDVSYNPVLLWSALVWIPVGGFLLWRRRQLDGGNRTFVFAAIMFAAAFSQNEVLCAAGRIIWVWYYLPIIPSLALGGAYLLTRREIPVWVRVAIGLLIAVGYFAAYILGPGLLTYD